MIYSEEFKVECPHGYQPVTNPVQWRTKDLVGNVNFLTLSFDIPIRVQNLDDLMNNVSRQLTDNYEIGSACTYSLIRNRRNSFIIGIDDRGRDCIINQLKDLKSKVSPELKIYLRSDYIWIFQKCSEKPLD